MARKTSDTGIIFLYEYPMVSSQQLKKYIRNKNFFFFYINICLMAIIPELGRIPSELQALRCLNFAVPRYFIKVPIP